MHTYPIFVSTTNGCTVFRTNERLTANEAIQRAIDTGKLTVPGVYIVARPDGSFLDAQTYRVSVPEPSPRLTFAKETVL